MQFIANALIRITNAFGKRLQMHLIRDYKCISGKG